MQVARRIKARGIAIPIRAVISALRRKILSSWRLRKLPDLREVNTATPGIWSCPGKHASRRWRANIVGHKERNLSSVSILLNVFGGDDAGLAFPGRNRRAIHASA